MVFVVTASVTVDPSVRPLMFLLLLSPESVIIGCGAFVSKTNPAGAVSTIVPALMSPTIVSTIVGPVRDVQAPLAVLAGMAPPPVAGATDASVKSFCAERPELRPFAVRRRVAPD